MPITVPGNPFSGPDAKQSTQAMGLHAAPETKYGKYGLIGSVVQNVDKEVRRYSDSLDKTRVLDATNRLKLFGNELDDNPETGWKSKKGSQALEKIDGQDLPSIVMKQYDDKVNEIRKDLNFRQRLAFDAYVKSDRAVRQMKLDHHMVAAAKASEQEAKDVAYKIAIDQMGSGDDAKYKEGHDSAIALLQWTANETGKEVLVMEHLSSAHLAGISTMIANGRIDAAKAALKTYDGEITSAHKAKIREAIKKTEEAAYAKTLTDSEVKKNPDLLNDTRSLEQVTLDIYNGNGKKNWERAQKAAEDYVAKRRKRKEVYDSQNAAEMKAGLDTIKNGGSVSDLVNADTLTEDQWAALSAYERRVKLGGSQISHSSVYQQLNSSDDALKSMTWAEFYAKRPFLNDADFDYFLQRKQILMSGKTPAGPQEKVRKIVKEFFPAPKSTSQSAMYGVALRTITDQLLADSEVTSGKVSDEAIRDRVRRFLNQEITYPKESALGWLPFFDSETKGKTTPGKLTSGKDEFSPGESIKGILSAGLSAVGVEEPTAEDLAETYFQIVIKKKSSITGADRMVDWMRANRKEDLDAIVEAFAKRGITQPDQSMIVRAYIESNAQ